MKMSDVTRAEGVNRVRHVRIGTWSGAGMT
jgi:hypothetical protein